MKPKKQPKPTPAPDFMPACRKKGKAVRFTFLCAIKKATGCDDKAAIAHFEAAVKDGRIKKVATNTAGDVGFFEALNLNEK